MANLIQFRWFAPRNKAAAPVGFSQIGRRFQSKRTKTVIFAPFDPEDGTNQYKCCSPNAKAIL
jgi:hypothetical protein